MKTILEAIRNRLCKLSGEDYAIIQKCNKKIQLYFSMIGLLVLIILICSFASALYFTEYMFHSLIADIGIGIVWGYIVTNMYILLLYTISPTLLPTKVRKKQVIKTYNFRLSFSMGFRIFIVILLATIIVQPLNVLILKPDSKKLTSEIEMFLRKKNEYVLITDIENILSDNSNSLLASDIKELISKNNHKLLISDINKELEKNSKSRLASEIQFVLTTKYLATIISIAVISIFLIPIYLKYRIRQLGEFYEKKAAIKKRFIQDDYQDFKKEYKQLLEANIANYNKVVWENLMPYLNQLEKINTALYQQYLSQIEKELMNEKFDKYEYWADPPYRTKHKPRTKRILSEQDLLNNIYPETN